MTDGELLKAVEDFSNRDFKCFDCGKVGKWGDFRWLLDRETGDLIGLVCQECCDKRREQET